MNLSNFGAVRKALYASAVLTIFAVPTFAQIVEKERTFADLTSSHPCSSGLTGRNAIVTDCDALDDVGDGGGAFRCFVHCDGTAPWETVAIGGGSGDVLLAGDADGQTVQGVAGANQARISIGEYQPDGVYIFGATAPGHPSAPMMSVDSGYFSAQSADTNTSLSVMNGALSGSSDSGISFNVNPSGGYFGADTSMFYAGGRINFVSTQTPPTNANDPCTAGDTIDTATFHYFCSAADTWVRVAMATW